MNYRALIGATALISTSFTPISLMTIPAQAAVPTMADMQDVCAQYDADGIGAEYQVITTAGIAVNGTPTADESTLRDDESTRVADHSTLSSPYGAMAYYGDAGRHGGSVNLFATSGYPGITFAGSLVNQIVDRVQTDTYNFTCQVQHWEVVGSHTVTTGNPGSDNPGKGNCVGDPSDGTVDGQGPGQGGDHASDNSACGTPTTTTVDDYGWVNQDLTNESLDNGPYYVDTVTENIAVPETVAVTEFDAAPYFAGDGAVCINPGKKGGTWSAKTGWTKTSQCTTLYFNTAPYISGANVFSSNSLPPL